MKSVKVLGNHSFFLWTHLFMNFLRNLVDTPSCLNVPSCGRYVLGVGAYHKTNRWQEGWIEKSIQSEIAKKTQKPVETNLVGGFNPFEK